MLDLTAIKARRDHGYDMPDISRTLALIDIDALLLEVERLQALEQYIIEFDKDRLDSINSWIEQYKNGKI